MKYMKKVQETNAIVLAWPDAEVFGEGLFHRTMMKLGLVKIMKYKAGHAALVLVNPRRQNQLEYYDMGRYMTPPGMGRVRTVNTDPDIHIPLKAKMDEAGNITNLEEIALFFSTHSALTHGEGVTYMSVCKRIDWDRIQAHISHFETTGSVRYGAIKPGSTNCSRFVSNALMSGCRNRWVYLKFLLPETVKSSPIGNVVNGATKKEVWRIEQEQIQVLKMNRWNALAYTYKNLIQSFNATQREPLRLADQCGQFIAPAIPKSLANKNVQWLGGLGAGAWLSIDSVPDHSTNLFRVRRYDADGKKIFDIIAKLDDAKLDLDLPYQFAYDTNRKKVTILQDNELKTLHFHSYFHELAVSYEL